MEKKYLFGTITYFYVLIYYFLVFLVEDSLQLQKIQHFTCNPDNQRAEPTQKINIAVKNSTNIFYFPCF